MKTITYEIKTKVVILMEDDVDPRDAFTELDYEFYPDMGQKIVDAELTDYQITRIQR